MKEFLERLKLAWSILRARDGNLVAHARAELQFGGHFDGDKISALAAQCVVDLTRVFSAQGHSGFSASFVKQIFEKVANFEPLGPVTGADDEWVEPCEGLFQNKRCSHVFKEGVDGVAYDSQGVIFREPSGSCFQGFGSRVPVTFPYTPKCIYVDLPENATDEQRAMLREQALAKAALD
jgi:hypothetical protein